MVKDNNKAEINIQEVQVELVKSMKCLRAILAENGSYTAHTYIKIAMTTAATAMNSIWCNNTSSPYCTNQYNYSLVSILTVILPLLCECEMWILFAAAGRTQVFECLRKLFAISVRE